MHKINASNLSRHLLLRVIRCLRLQKILCRVLPHGKALVDVTGCEPDSSTNFSRNQGSPETGTAFARSREIIGEIGLLLRNLIYAFIMRCDSLFV